MSSEHVVDLRVARNRLFLSTGRIDIDVVPTATTMQNAAMLLKLLNKLPSLHKAISFV
jgi:hypothetical protein